MAYSLIAHAIGGSVAATPRTATTAPPIDTTGADLIIIGVSFYEQSTRAIPTDSKSNSPWNALTESVAGAFDVVERLFWITPTSVGANHTFTYTSVDDSFPCIAVAAFSGSKASPFDVQNGATATGASSIQTGSVTPSESNELIVTGLGVNVDITSIDSGFTITDKLAFVSGDRFGGGLAYKIKTDALGENPTWTASSSLAARIATFKALASTTSVIVGQDGILTGSGMAMYPIGPMIGFGM